MQQPRGQLQGTPRSLGSILETKGGLWGIFSKTLSDRWVFETLCLQLQQLPPEAMGTGPRGRAPGVWGADNKSTGQQSHPAASVCSTARHQPGA